MVSGSVGLQFDRTGSGRLGGGHDGQRAFQVAVVVGREFSDHIGRLHRA